MIWCTITKTRSHQPFDWEHLGLRTVGESLLPSLIIFPGTGGSSFARLAEPCLELKSAHECHTHRIAKSLPSHVTRHPSCPLRVDLGYCLECSLSTQQLLGCVSCSRCGPNSLIQLALLGLLKIICWRVSYAACHEEL